MHAIKTVRAKNGQTYYYVSGKRISAKAAQEIMNAPATPATPAAPAAQRPQRPTHILSCACLYFYCVFKRYQAVKDAIASQI